jgi:uncharacterized membrane protein
VIGISGIVGIVLAYLNRGKSEAWLESHYTWAIRTFWIGLLGSFISFASCSSWSSVCSRSSGCNLGHRPHVIGLQKLGRNEPIADPESWLL